MQSMKNKWARISLLLMLSVLTQSSSCKKDDKDPEPDPYANCNAGKNGQLSIRANFKHHSKNIPGCTLFIKYNQEEFPGHPDSTAYDLIVPAGSDSSFLTIDSLDCGKYYLFATGIDSALDPSIWIVQGGIPYSTTDKQGFVNLIVPVTEGD